VSANLGIESCNLCCCSNSSAHRRQLLHEPARSWRRRGESTKELEKRRTMTAASTIVIVRQVLRTALGSSAARHGCRRQCHLTRHKSRLAKAMHKVCPTSEGRLERAAVKPAAASVQGGATSQCRAHMMQAARCAALARAWAVAGHASSDVPQHARNAGDLSASSRSCDVASWRRFYSSPC